jgi:hypothetical protein
MKPGRCIITNPSDKILEVFTSEMRAAILNEFQATTRRAMAAIPNLKDVKSKTFRMKGISVTISATNRG